MKEQAKLAVDKQKLLNAIKMGAPVSITSYTLPRATEAFIMDVTSAFLQLLHREDIIDCITYCLKELTTNAKKANTKRIYFTEKGLSLFKQSEYEEGMKTFKEDTLNNQAHYLQLQKDARLYVKVTLYASESVIKIKVQNNSQMTRTEFKRMFDKVARAKQFTSLNDAMSQILDSSEGAGLGIVIMILMLKKIGLGVDAFEFSSENGITESVITIPRNTNFKKDIEDLAETITDYIDKVPQFPKRVSEIQEAMRDPDVKISKIAALISEDIGFAADLLKCVNSAAFGLSKKCMNIAEAVKLMGLRGVQNMVYSLTSMQILGSTEEDQKKLWDDAYKLAFYSLNVAKMQNDRAIIEDSYVCGLLHYLGKIVFSSVYPETMVKLTELQAERNIPIQAMDYIMQGMGYATIGASLATKWNLPKPIIDTIKYKNNYNDAPEETRDLVMTICFADFMKCFSEGIIEYYQIPEDLLKKFKIQNEAELTILCKKLEENFTNGLNLEG